MKLSGLVGCSANNCLAQGERVTGRSVAPSMEHPRWSSEGWMANKLIWNWVNEGRSALGNRIGFRLTKRDARSDRGWESLFLSTYESGHSHMSKWRGRRELATDGCKIQLASSSLPTESESEGCEGPNEV